MSQSTNVLETWIFDGVEIIRNKDGDVISPHIEDGPRVKWRCSTCGRVGNGGNEAYNHRDCGCQFPLVVIPKYRVLKTSIHA
jgi:hypothetical protein